MGPAFPKATNQDRFASPMTDSSPAAEAAPSPLDLACRLAARLCHDFISPASAIVSGLDLIEDPEQQDMREEAMDLIASSARKLAALLSFSRAAFGGSAAAESFDVRELEALTRGLYEHARADLDWRVEPPALAKTAARLVLNLAQLGASALPMGGMARLAVKADEGGLRLSLDAEGPRARLRPEAVDGLQGRPLGEGLGGPWVQAYFLRALVDDARGRLDLVEEDGAVRVRIHLPAA
jgi:histidine phosphotransferase ChpT